MAEHGDDLINFGAQVQADVSGDLVVAATAGVQALARIADQLCQTRFDIEVNVFEFKLPEELAGLDLIAMPRRISAKSCSEITPQAASI